MEAWEYKMRLHLKIRNNMIINNNKPPIIKTKNIKDRKNISKKKKSERNMNHQQLD